MVKRKAALLLSLLLLIGLPPVGWGYFNLSRAEMLRQNSPAQAAAAYATAARLLFWQPGLREEAGLAAFQAGETEQALSLFIAAQGREGLSPQGLMTLGDIYRLQDAPEAAYTQAWLPLFETGFASPELLTRLAGYAAQQQDPALETRYLTRLLELTPAQASAHDRLARLLAADDPQAALLHLEQAVRLDAGRLPQAEPLQSALRQALSQDDRVYGRILIGRALAAQGEWPLALSAFRQAAEENPNYAEAWAWQAEALYQTRGDDSLAASYYEQALALNPNSAGVQVLAGLYQERKRNYPQAEAHYLKAVTLEPENPAWRLALAGAMARRNLPAALQQYQTATQLAPRDPSVWLALAAFSVEYEAFLEDVGLEAALQAYALQPENPQVLDLLGQALAAVGQVASAQSMYEKALALAPTLPAAHFHLALLYLQSGQHALAKERLMQVVYLDLDGPYSLQAQDILARYFP